MHTKTKKRPKTGGRQKGSGGVRVFVTIPKETADKLPSNAKELRREVLDAVLEKVKKQTMQYTCEFPHPEYGTLVLRGQIFEAEPENDLEAQAMLESILTYDGDELLAYSNGGAVGFTRAEIAEMESSLLHRGTRPGRVKPAPETLRFLRQEILGA